jgi:hypothetical protein
LKTEVSNEEVYGSEKRGVLCGSWGDTLSAWSNYLG